MNYQYYFIFTSVFTFFLVFFFLLPIQCFHLESFSLSLRNFNIFHSSRCLEKTFLNFYLSENAFVFAFSFDLHFTAIFSPNFSFFFFLDFTC